MRCGSVNRSPSPCTHGSRTTEAFVPAAARRMSVRSTFLPSRPARSEALSSSVIRGPALRTGAKPPAATRGRGLPENAAATASRAARSVRAARRMRSGLALSKAVWIAASARPAAACRAVGSSRLPRTGSAPAAARASAERCERARPST